MGQKTQKTQKKKITSIKKKIKTLEIKSPSFVQILIMGQKT